jgi:hypothetical protein
VSTDDFTRQSLDGERVIWSGRPGQGSSATGRAGLLIPFLAADRLTIDPRRPSANDMFS